jgi:hypothetical protein
MDDPPPVTVFTFVAELPYTLPIRHNSQAVYFETHTSGWNGWPAELVGQLLGPEAPQFPHGQVPGTRIVVRHVDVVGTMPLAAATEAFADWVEPLLTEREIQVRRAELAAWQSSGFAIVRSVVALTRFVPRSKHPTAEAMTVGWMRSLFQTALADLNTMLEALGLTSHQWAVGAVSPRDLPALLPTLIENSHGDSNGNRLGASFLLHIHDAFPAVPGLFDPEPEPVERAVELSNAANHGDQPFMLAFRFVHAAYAERLAGDPTRAVVDLNTAIEVLVSALLAEGGRAARWDSHKIERATSDRVGLRNRLTDHLAPLLGDDVCLDDPDTPWGRWWLAGYSKRNAAVHTGARLTRDDAESALQAATKLVEHLKDRLIASDDLQPLAERLAISLGSAPPWEDGPLGQDFPWESLGAA